MLHFHIMIITSFMVVLHNCDAYSSVALDGAVFQFTTFQTLKLLCAEYKMYDCYSSEAHHEARLHICQI